MVRDTIYLVDDHDGFRSSTQFLLESRDLRVISFADGRSFLRGYAPPSMSDERHCLLLDVRMPEMSGLQLQEEIRARGYRIPVIFMTAHGDIPLAVAAMRNGALDFLEKPFTEDSVVAAVETALTFKVKPPEGPSGDPAIQARIACLTARERQVFDLVVTGKLNKTIADGLGISIKTVELHRSRVMDKMQAKSVAELVQFALRAGDPA